MSPRAKVLKQLVADEHYVIDVSAIAEAIVLRSMVLRTLPDVTFRRETTRAKRRGFARFARIMGRGRFG